VHHTDIFYDGTYYGGGGGGGGGVTGCSSSDGFLMHMLCKW